jgi:hypothetical protein
MSVISGKSGTLKLAENVVTPVSNWKLDLAVQSKSYVANDTGGALRRLAGAADCAGSFQCNATDDGVCPVAVGQGFAAELHVDQSGNNYYQAPILIEKIGVNCDIQQGEPVAYIVEFSGDGPVLSYGVLAIAGGS